MNSNNVFPSLLLLIFITLKLCHVIAWSWWWVLSPLWITLILVLIIALVAIGIKLPEIRKQMLNSKQREGKS